MTGTIKLSRFARRHTKLPVELPLEIPQWLPEAYLNQIFYKPPLVKATGFVVGYETWRLL